MKTTETLCESFAKAADKVLSSDYNQIQEQNNVKGVASIARLLIQKENEIEQEKIEIIRQLQEYKRAYETVKRHHPEIQISWSNTLVFKNKESISAVARDLNVILHTPTPEQPTHWFTYRINANLTLYCEA